MSEAGFYLKFLHLFKRYLFARWASHRLGLDSQLMRAEDTSAEETRLKVDGRYADFFYYFKPQYDSMDKYGVDPQYAVIVPETTLTRYSTDIRSTLDLIFQVEFPRCHRMVRGEQVQIREMSAYYRMPFNKMQDLAKRNKMPRARLRNYKNFVLDVRYGQLLELFFGKVKVDFAYLDVETSGLAIEMGAVPLSLAVIAPDGDVFDRMIRPSDEDWRMAKPASLEANGITWDVISQADPIDIVGPQLANFFREKSIEYGKTMIVGQNPHFDRKYLHQFFGPYLAPLRVPLDSVLDVRWIYRTLMRNDLVPKLERCHGIDIARELGVEAEPWPHTALNGANQVKRNFIELLRLARLERHV